MKSRWAILILFLAGILAYANTAKNGLFWDDDEFITKNAYVKSLGYIGQWFTKPLTYGAGVMSNYYRPLLLASFAVDYKLWGAWPAGYHLENMLWHTTAAILLYFFLKELLRNLEFRISNFEFAAPTAFAAALLWLVHPVHAEAVAYANSRGDSMATAFILLSLIFWLKRRFWASAAAFAAALLSKEFAIVTPGLILLTEFIKFIKNDCLDDRRSSLIYTVISASKKLFKSLTIVDNLNNYFKKPIFIHVVITIIYISLRLTVLNFQNTLNFYGVDLSRVDRNEPMAQYATSVGVRGLTFLKVLPIYAKILIWPDDLHMERTVEIPRGFNDPMVLESLIAATVILALSTVIVYKGPALRGKAGPFQIIPLAVGWFFISIIPVSGLIPISQILAEHFLYLPSIGFFLIAAWAIVRLVNLAAGTLRLNDSNHLTFRYASYGTILLMLSIPLVIKTIRQNRIWREPIGFYEYTLARAKPTARVYNNLAMAYADAGEHQKAINNYQLAIGLGDVYPNPHYNLGNTLLELGRVEEAEREYRRALEIDSSFHYATLKLGQMYLDRGKVDEAKNIVCPVYPTLPLCR